MTEGEAFMNELLKGIQYQPEPFQYTLPIHTLQRLYGVSAAEVYENDKKDTFCVHIITFTPLPLHRLCPDFLSDDVGLSKHIVHSKYEALSFV